MKPDNQAIKRRRKRHDQSTPDETREQRQKRQERNARKQERAKLREAVKKPSPRPINRRARRAVKLLKRYGLVVAL